MFFLIVECRKIALFKFYLLWSRLDRSLVAVIPYRLILVFNGFKKNTHFSIKDEFIQSHANWPFIFVSFKTQFFFLEKRCRKRPGEKKKKHDKAHHNSIHKEQTGSNKYNKGRKSYKQLNAKCTWLHTSSGIGDRKACVVSYASYLLYSKNGKVGTWKINDFVWSIMNPKNYFCAIWKRRRNDQNDSKQNAELSIVSKSDCNTTVFVSDKQV